MFFHYQALSFGTSHEKVIPSGWEGNHRSGVALPYVTELNIVPTQAPGLSKGNEHSVYSPVHGLGTIYFFKQTAAHIFISRNKTETKDEQ